MSYVNSPKKHKEKSSQNDKEKGLSVLYVVFIASILLAISLGISALLVSQIKMMREIGYSVVAFYAADSGIERVLVARGDDPLDIGETFLDNGATYEVVVAKGGDQDCSADFTYCIKSIGAYKGVRRAIEITY